MQCYINDMKYRINFKKQIEIMTPAEMLITLTIGAFIFKVLLDISYIVNHVNVKCFICF